MNTRLLKAFVVLAEKGNYAQAAQALSISQPALTKQINLLESRVNLALFTRGRHGTALTAGGQRLLPEARKVVGQVGQFLYHAEQVSKGREGFLAAGFGLSSFYFAPGCIARFRKCYPGVEITLEDLPSAQQYEMLQSGALQVGFVRVPPAKPLSYHSLFEDCLVLVTPENTGMSLESWLQKLPLLRLYPERGGGLNTQTTLFLHERHIFPAATQQVEDIQTIVALIVAGIGVALLPQSVVHIAPPGLNIIPIPGEATRWQVGIAWDPRHDDSVRDNFIAIAKGFVR
ncbi:LysR family transcriptional regulator [Rahnella sp. PCH160]|uniref:LysR family transcriptional regulator n=1 Tax=Rahnella sp. PCH160 TaxID=3447928 RepID=UPI0039FC997B